MISLFDMEGCALDSLFNQHIKSINLQPQYNQSILSQKSSCNENIFTYQTFYTTNSLTHVKIQKYLNDDYMQQNYFVMYYQLIRFYFNISLYQNLNTKIGIIIIMQQQQSQNVKQPILNISTNKTIRKCLKILMHQLLHQYRSQYYDYNKILNQYYLHMEQLKEHYNNQRQQSSKQQCTDTTVLSVNEVEEKQQDQANTRLSNVQVQTVSEQEVKQYFELRKIWPQISVFIWEMAHSPRAYVEMLRKQEIYAEINQCIDMHVFTTKIYKKVMLQASELTPYTKQFENICADQIYFFLQQISFQICQCFKSGQQIVINQLNYATSIVQKSEIINFYLLFKIFKDISLVCKHRIIGQLQQGLFRCIEVDVVENFALYIIEKYEILDMDMHLDEQGTFRDMQPQKIPLIQKIMNSNNVKWREAIRQDGEIGILVQLQDESQGKRLTNYMLMFDDDGRISIMNRNSLNMQWKVCKKAQQNNILHLIKDKKALAQKFRTTPLAPVQMTLLENVGAVGGTMGKCLAQINSFDNVGDFMVSLSKRTVIGGSFNYILTQVPLLGLLFVTGGFTYTFYNIFTNKYANTNKKLRQLRNITIGSLASVGSGIVGAVVGQALIPLPILGAFIGGMVGGFLGQYGVRSIKQSLDTVKFKQTIEQMKEMIQPQGYWNVSKRTLKILEIKKQRFYETIPKSLQCKMNCDRIWLTLILFTILCFHQSKQRIKIMQKSMKEVKDQRMSQSQIIEANQNIKSSKQYEPSSNYMCVIKYLANNQIIFLEFHDQIVHLLNKIFARLK